MKKLKLILTAIALSVLVGCTTLSNMSSNDLLVQYSTMKLIEQSSDVTPETTILTVQRVRGVLEVSEVELNFDELKEELAELIGFQNLAPSDRLLISAVVGEYELTLQKTYEVDVVTDEVKLSINQFLDLVEQAARMSQ